MTNPTTGGRAVTVGEVVFGSEVPELDGQLLLGDFPNGVIYTLDVDDGLLNGGQDELNELLLVDVTSDSTDPVRLLDLINANLGDTPSVRADLRFGFNTGEDVFILNKQDGIIRRLVAVPAAVPEPKSTTLFLVLTSCLVALRSRHRN